MEANNCNRNMKTIGLRFPEWVMQRYELIKGMVTYARSRNMDWKFCSEVPSGFEVPELNIDKDWDGDGIVAFRCSAEEQQAWLEKGIKVVTLSSESPDAGAIRVLPDNYAIGKEAGLHLIEMGVESFVFIGDPHREYSTQREAGFKDILTEHSLSYTPIHIPISQWSDQQRADKLTEALLAICNDHLSEGSGIFVRDDMLGMRLIQILEQLDISVPQQVCVVGAGNSEIHCHLANPTLSSVHYSSQHAGFVAGAVMERLLAELEVQNQTIPTQKVVERNSTTVRSGGDELVTEALKIIKREARRSSINVKDLAEQLGVSYSSLRHRFREATGRTVKDELIRVRTKRIYKLLVETDVSIKEIGLEMGFTRPEDFTRYVRRELGAAPSEIRKMNQLETAP